MAEENAVARLHRRDVGTDLDDPSGALVAEDERQLNTEVPVEHGHVAVADAAGLDLHDDVGASRRGQGRRGRCRRHVSRSWATTSSLAIPDVRAVLFILARGEPYLCARAAATWRQRRGWRPDP